MPETPDLEESFGSFFDNLSALAADKKPIPADFGKDPAVTDPAALADAAAARTTDTPTVTPDTTATDTSAATGGGGGAAATTTSDPARVEPVVAAPTPKPDETSLITRMVEALEKRPQPQPQHQPQYQPAPLYNADELKVLEQAQKDWPDLMNAMALALRGASATTQQTIFKQLGETLGPTLQNLQVVQTDHQYDALIRAIPDYDKVADPVVQWARTDKSIPKMLRDTYERVIQDGDVSEIKYLVDTWRTATGKSAAQQTAQTTQAPATKERELSEAAKQAAASLAPVVSKRSAVVTSQEPQDYDGAFDHWAATKA